ncbi:hypothetical protein GCM10010412_100750 [Nonomuraea recticatena]|uniref:Uncharacterized protein n=1 Tax=Nonomuraea recticatena TaxID=46178 RepID=A0ABN3TFD5_9ACTN
MVRGPLNMGYGVEVTLERDTVGWGGREYGFAKIKGNTGPYDNIWMDWTRDGGRTWLQCGPFQVGGYNLSKTSAAKYTSSDANYQFRACGSVAYNHVVICTTWW